jgi:hypothetical protein
MLGLGVLALGLPSLALADDTMAPQSSPPQVATQPAPQQSATPYNPNKVPAWSNLRNGDGDPVDPATGVTAPGYGGNQGGGF